MIDGIALALGYTVMVAAGWVAALYAFGWLADRSTWCRELVKWAWRRRREQKRRERAG